jgi:hypothetical protein
LNKIIYKNHIKIIFDLILLVNGKIKVLLITDQCRDKLEILKPIGVMRQLIKAQNSNLII